MFNYVNNYLYFKTKRQKIASFINPRLRSLRLRLEGSLSLEAISYQK